MASYRGKAFYYLGKPGAVERGELEVHCGPTDLVVRVLMCARCGTDKTIYRNGHPNVDPYAPVVLGHELVARVVEVGREVRTLHAGIGHREGRPLSDEELAFEPGERLTFQSRIARYRDGLMLIPKPLANLSFQINGGYAEYMRVPESLIRSGSVLRVPEGLSDEEACLVEPAACALESIFQTAHAVGVDVEGRHRFRAGILPGGRTCVIGSGTVSLIYAALAHLEGAAQVLLVVRSESKAALARARLGAWLQVYVMPRIADEATPEALAAEDAVVSDLAALTEGKLFDDVVAACASPQAQRLMLRLYAPEGYAVGACFGGTRHLVAGANLDLHHYRAATTIGTSGCSTDCMHTILRWLAAGRLQLNGLIASRRWTLDDDPHAFFTTEEEGLKPALYMEEG